MIEYQCPHLIISWNPNVYSLLGVLIGLGSLLVAGIAYQWRGQLGSQWFVLLIMVLGIWSLVYSIQLGFTTKSTQLLFQRIGLAAGGTIPTIWFFFAFIYAGSDEIFTPRRQAVMTIEPVLFGLLTLTNPAHNLIWDSAVVVSTGTLDTIKLSLASGYYIHIAYAYLLITAGLAYLGFVFIRAANPYSRYAVIFFLAVLPPVIANIAYSLRIPWGLPPVIDFTPFTFSFTSAIFAVAIYRFDLLERTPVARKQVIDEMGDGLIVLTAEGIISEMNEVATEVIPSVGVGDPVTILGSDETAGATETLQELHGKTLDARINGCQRTFDVQRSILTSHNNERVGNALILRDITERDLHRQKLEVSQRVLRHNLRNEMNIISGMANKIQQKADGDTASTATKIINRSNSLIKISDQARKMTELGNNQMKTKTNVSLPQFIPKLLQELRTRYPFATIEEDVPENLSTICVDEQFVSIIIQNLVENGIEHNDGENPHVRVSLRESSTHIALRIEDNGPGIPKSEQRALEKEGETPLQHGSGLGLWLVHWSVRASGGDLSFATSDDLGGTAVVVQVPLGDTGVLRRSTQTH